MGFYSSATEVCNSNLGLAAGKTYKVRLTASQSSTVTSRLTMHIDNVLTCFAELPGKALPALAKGALYMSQDANIPASNVGVKNFKFGPLARLSWGSDMLMGKTMAPIKGNLLGVINTLKSYHLSFKITPTGTVSTWSNILHVTANGNYGCDPTEALSIGRTYLLDFKVKANIYTVSVDGVVKCSAKADGSAQGAMSNSYVWF